jgi:hypothetical protein
MRHKARPHGGLNASTASPHLADIIDIVARLEAAGATLLALRIAIGPQEPRSGLPEPVREVWGVLRLVQATPRPADPCAAAIDAMDEALAWVQLIPADRYVLRRIVNARALVSPPPSATSTAGAPSPG